MKKLLSFVLVFVMITGLFSIVSAADTVDGTYTKTVRGFYDGLQVQVVIADGRIESVEVLEHEETAPGWPAIERLPQAIVDAQSIAVDTIAGASRTSEGILEAVELALVEAGADLEAFTLAPEETVSLDYYPTMGSVELPEAWDESYDVVIVGGGFAGLAAAFAASENGASTTLIEKLSTTGGNSAINGGQYASWTSARADALQTSLDLEPDTAEKHIEDTMAGGDFMSKLSLVKNMVYGGAVYFDLLLENGLVTRDVLARPGGHYGYRTYVTENQVGSDITNLQADILEKTDCVVQLDTKMVEIYRTRDDENKVVGIRVATVDGYKTIEAKEGLILATGGFGANVPMRENQVPYLDASIPTTNNVAASTGEGIYLAQAIGAGTTQMSNIQRYPFADSVTGVLDKYAVWPFTGPSFGIVYIDYQGNRYVNEGERRDVCANAAANSGFVSTYSLFTEPVVSGFIAEGELEGGLAAGRIIMGETLEELAQAMNETEIKGQFPDVTAENLAATIDMHNGYIDNGTDEEFGKVMADTMVKMEEGPYYAIPQFPSVHHTMGGLVIDDKTQVYDIYGNVISKLYAAGEVTGGVHGTNRLGSNADTDACGMGYISGIYVSTGDMPDLVPED